MAARDAAIITRVNEELALSFVMPATARVPAVLHDVVGAMPSDTAAAPRSSSSRKRRRSPLPPPSSSSWSWSPLPTSVEADPLRTFSLARAITLPPGSERLLPLVVAHTRQQPIHAPTLRRHQSSLGRENPNRPNTAKRDHRHGARDAIFASAHSKHTLSRAAAPRTQRHGTAVGANYGKDLKSRVTVVPRATTRETSSHAAATIRVFIRADRPSRERGRAARLCARDIRRAFLAVFADVRCFANGLPGRFGHGGREPTRLRFELCEVSEKETSGRSRFCEPREKSMRKIDRLIAETGNIMCTLGESRDDFNVIRGAVIFSNSNGRRASRYVQAFSFFFRTELLMNNDIYIHSYIDIYIYNIRYVHYSHVIAIIISSCRRDRRYILECERECRGHD